jgi:hypothetical protein
MATHREDATNGAPHEKEQHGVGRAGKRQASRGETVQLIFTLNEATGAVISIERVDPAWKRHEVQPEETFALAGRGNLREIEAALDEAFEAGISSVLEPSSPEEPQHESEEEAELRRALLASMISQNVRRRLQRRLAQRLALSQTLAH